MSDHWITIIPRDPCFVPPADAIARARDFIAEITPAADDISSEISTGVQFRDCGANLERIQCPVCKADISRDWWSEQMEEDSEGDGFDLQPFALPCGHTAGSLNGLDYYFDQGFSRFALNARNPNIDKFDPSHIARLEQLLGCPVKIIYRHV